MRAYVRKVLLMVTKSSAPLSGVRVLDLSNVLSGPYCCYQLALLGAEVIKVERPISGDLARQLGSDAERNKNNMGISFLAQNAGKKSITLDLKSPEGKSLLKKLVSKADVLVENFRPGVMDRLGLGYETLKIHNKNLVYCAITGFGQTGPWVDKPAYDQIIQGVSGMMSITGDAASAPLRVGYPLADTAGGMTAAFSITAALNAEARGAFIDISMTEAVISNMGWVVSNHLIGDVTPSAHGNENTTSAPSGTFRCSDSPINIAANKDEQWALLAIHLNREDLLTHSDYKTREDRKRNRVALRAEIESVLIKRPAHKWVEELSATSVPVGPIYSVPEILQQEQILSRDLIATYDDYADKISVVASPALFDDVRPRASHPPAQLGEHNEEVYQSLGVTSDELDELKDKNII